MTATHYALLGALVLLFAAALAWASERDRRVKAEELADYHAAETEDADKTARAWEEAHERGVGEWKKRALDAEQALADLRDADRCLPLAPWPGEPLRVGEITAAHERLMAQVARMEARA